MDSIHHIKNINPRPYEQPIQEAVPATKIQQFNPFITGACAGVGFSTLHPINVWKNHLQQGKTFLLKNSCQGYGTHLVFASITFSCQNGFKHLFRSNAEDKTPSSISSELFPTISSALVASLMLNPAERVLTQRISTQDSSMYATAKKIYAQHGLKGYYTGLNWAIARNVPFFVGMNILGPKIAQKIEGTFSPFTEPYSKLVASFLGFKISGFCNGLVTFPADLIKTRVQTGQYKGSWKGCRAFTELFKQQGFPGLCKGLIGRQIIAMYGPMTACFILQYLEKTPSPEGNRAA